MQDKRDITGKRNLENLTSGKVKKDWNATAKTKLTKLISVAVIVMMIAVFQTGNAYGHGTEPLEEDNCSRRSGEYLVHLSAYQPQNDIAGHYCADIPVAGSTLLVIDLVDPPLREIPIGVKLLKGHSEEGDVIAELRPAIYVDGVINTQQELEEGRHLLVITGDGMPPLKYVYQLRVEMINYAEVFRATIGPAVGLLLITLIGYKLLKSKRFKSWMGNRRKKKTAISED